MNTVGIYSYPKSGNTWLRSIIGTRVENGRYGVPDLYTHPLSSARELNGFRFYKHHGRRPVEEAKGEPVETSHFIHIRRNPLDVFLSLMNFLSDNVTGKAVKRFASVEAIAGTELFHDYFETFLTHGHLRYMVVHTGDWFSHNAWWTDFTGRHPHAAAIRYEDMMADPVATLSFLGDWLGLSAAEIGDMVEGARGMTAVDGRFFWRQQEKTYWSFLGEAEVRRFVERRGAEAEALGYSPDYLLARPRTSGPEDGPLHQSL